LSEVSRDVDILEQTVNNLLRRTNDLEKQNKLLARQVLWLKKAIRDSGITAPNEPNDPNDNDPNKILLKKP